MNNSHATYEVQLSLGSLVYLTGLTGFCAGVPLGVLGALYALTQDASWAEALIALFLSPFVAGLTFAVYAGIGYPIYTRLSKRTPTARQLTGVFVKTDDTSNPTL